MANDLVTLTTFDRPDEMALAQMHLESNGIQCAALDENVKWATSLPAAAGGMRLQVRDCDALRAAEVLREMGIDIELPPVCPECHSQRITRSDLLFPRVFLTLLMLPFVFPFYRAKWLCLQCRHRWRS